MDLDSMKLPSHTSANDVELDAYPKMREMLVACLWISRPWPPHARLLLYPADQMSITSSISCYPIGYSPFPYQMLESFRPSFDSHAHLKTVQHASAQQLITY